MKKELKGKALSSPEVYFSKSRLLRSFKEIKNYNGRYSGKLYYIIGSKKGRIDQIDIEVNFIIKDEDIIEGNSSLKFLENGVVYNHKSGNGANGMIREVDGNIILVAGPGLFIHFVNQNLTAAYYYKDGKILGMIRLVKR